jgi:hypothetical protein
MQVHIGYFLLPELIFKRVKRVVKSLYENTKKTARADEVMDSSLIYKIQVLKVTRTRYSE